MRQTFDIPLSRLARLRKRMDAACSRAARLGLPVPRMSAGAPWHREFDIPDPLSAIRGDGSGFRTVGVRMATVTVEGEDPAAEGWRVTGYREAWKDAQGRQHLWNSPEVPAAMHGRDLCCEHCGFSRRRKASFVVAAPQGGMHEVGSTCLGAFTGSPGLHAAADSLMEIGSVLRGLEEASRQDPALAQEDLDEEVRSVIAFAAARIAADGFESSRDGNLPTWRLVMEDLAAARSPAFCADDAPVTAADFMLADEIAAGIMEGPPTPFGDAARRAVTSGLAGARDVAVLTAATDGHMRRARRFAEARAARAEAAASRHVGEAGERLTLVAALRSSRRAETRYGSLCFMTLVTPGGDLVAWNTGRVPEGVRPGHAYEITGTVKEHRTCGGGPLEGLPETVLTRVRVLADLGPSQPHGQLDGEDEAALDSAFGPAA